MTKKLIPFFPSSRHLGIFLKKFSVPVVPQQNLKAYQNKRVKASKFWKRNRNRDKIVDVIIILKLYRFDEVK